MANATKTTKKAGTRNTRTANRNSTTKSGKAAIKIGKLDPQETIQQSLMLIMRHPVNEQGNIIAGIYGGLKKSIVNMVQEADSRSNYLHESANMLHKLIEEAHYGSPSNGISKSDAMQFIKHN